MLPSFARLAALVSLGVSAWRTAEAEVPEPRSEVPVRQVTLSDGTIRYGIAVKLGETIVEALLDTGTTGLRVLAGSVPADASRDGPGDRIAVGPGTELVGTASKARITVGGLSAPSPFELVEEVKCQPGQSHCPATDVPFDRYGIGADGLPGEGFPALLGIKMGPSDIANPLAAIGAKRWIVVLPRPGEAGPGKLVLNPRDDEIAGFARIPILWTFRHYQPLHDAIKGCLEKSGKGEKACGTMTFDTGFPAMDVYGAHQAWPEHTKAELTISDGTAPRAVMSFDAGVKEHASQVFFDLRRGPAIFAGVVPYFAFEVLYDPDANEIGLKPRAGMAGVAAGRLVP